MTYIKKPATELRSLKTMIASPPYREGLVVIVYEAVENEHIELVELYYENKELKVEIFQNGSDICAVRFEEFLSALKKAEAIMRDDIIPY